MLGQQQVAKLIALKGVELRIVGLPLLLPPLSVSKSLRRLLASAGGVQGISMGRAAGHHTKLIATVVSMDHRLFRRRYSGGDLAVLHRLSGDEERRVPHHRDVAEQDAGGVHDHGARAGVT